MWHRAASAIARMVAPAAGAGLAGAAPRESDEHVDRVDELPEPVADTGEDQSEMQVVAAGASSSCTSRT
jgi:hypothetical protein